MPSPDLSVVVPLYNEEGNVRPFCEAIRSALRDRDYELILVDDGSTDGTARRLREEADRDPGIRVVSLERNQGQTVAMATGFARSRGRIIVSLDGDLQNDPRDIPELISRLEDGFDMVCGCREDRKDPFLSRILPSRIANLLISWMTGVPIHDSGCTLKAYRAEIIQSLNLYSEMHRFLPALSAMTGARITEVPVRHHARRHGRSKYGIARTFAVLGDMIAVRMISRFGTRPGIWFTLLSIPWLILGLLAAASWLAGVWLPDWPGGIVLPSLALVFLYLFGHMVSLVILSETYLVHSDREYVRRLARVLTVAREHRSPGTGEGKAGS